MITKEKLHTFLGVSLVVVSLIVIGGLVGHFVMVNSEKLQADTLYSSYQDNKKDTTTAIHIDSLKPIVIVRWDSVEKENKKPHINKCDTTKYVRQIKEMRADIQALTEAGIELSHENEELRGKLELLKAIIDEQNQVINKLAPSTNNTLFKLHYGYYAAK